MDKICGIYEIINKVNGKKYIGQSVNVKRRLSDHKRCLRSNIHHNKYLQSAWNKYGENNFEFNILLCCNRDELDNYETEYITKYNTCNKEFGYNLESGGNKNKALAPETVESIRKRMIVIMKDKYSDPEEVEKDRQYLLKYYLEHPEAIEKKRQYSIELYKNNPELIEICRQSSLKYWNNEDNKIKRSNEMKERYKNQDERNNQRKRALKLWKNEEHKIKQREGMKKCKKARPVICIETGMYFEMCSDAIRWLNRPVNASGNIKRACDDPNKTCGGYHWKYAEK